MVKRAIPLLLVVALAACGGGGGSVSASSPAPATPAPATAPPGAPVTTVAVQRSVVNQALTVLSDANFSFAFGSASTLSLSRRIREAARHGSTAGHTNSAAATTRHAQSVTYSACNNGTESATIFAANDEQIYNRTFYDAACTQIFTDTFLDIPIASLSKVNATGNVTTYAKSGGVDDYTALTLALTLTTSSSGSITLQATNAPNPNAKPIQNVGISCTTTGTSINCGAGSTLSVDALAQDFGTTLTIASTDTAANGTSTIGLSGTTSDYQAGLGQLSLAQGTFPAWAIGGANASDTATYTGTFTYTSAGILNTAALTLTDTADDATVSITTSAGTVNGTITQSDSGKTYATFTVDIAGDGTITYGNGTTVTIVNWQITG